MKKDWLWQIWERQNLRRVVLSKYACPLINSEWHLDISKRVILDRQKLIHDSNPAAAKQNRELDFRFFHACYSFALCVQRKERERKKALLIWTENMVHFLLSFLPFKAFLSSFHGNYSERKPGGIVRAYLRWTVRILYAHCVRGRERAASISWFWTCFTREIARRQYTQMPGGNQLVMLKIDHWTEL